MLLSNFIEKLLANDSLSLSAFLPNVQDLPHLHMRGLRVDDFNRTVVIV